MTKINLQKFCNVSGIKNSDASACIKKYSNSITKTYTEWFELISSDFTVPNDMRKFFKEEVKVEEKVVEEIEEQPKEEKKEKHSFNFNKKK